VLCVSQLFIKVQIPLVTICEFRRDTTEGVQGQNSNGIPTADWG